MGSFLSLSLRNGVRLATARADELTFQMGDRQITLKRLTPSVREALENLVGGQDESQLEDFVLMRNGGDGLNTLYYYLQQLDRRGLLLRSARDTGRRLATLVPISGDFHYGNDAVDPKQLYALSRFAYTRAAGGEVWLESPLAHARFVLHDWRAAALVHALARPKSVGEIGDSIPGLSKKAAATLMELLLNASMLGAADTSGTPAADGPPALQSWEFHDLLFHARSREGRHDQPVGGTFRLAGKLEPPPAVKPAPANELIKLAIPDLNRLQRKDPPFAQVQEKRCSIREYGKKPITTGQLAEFLYRVGRVRERSEIELDTPSGDVRLEIAMRPYPAGGALYEMELYTAIRACEGLRPGLYHYDAARHVLGRVAEQTAEVEQLLGEAGLATGIPEAELQVLVILAARFQRVTWKYESMAYALILKHVGVLYQTMYLAATAMNLAPCAVGCGNSDLFTRALGTDYFAETSVGEFLLGNRP